MTQDAAAYKPLQNNYFFFLNKIVREKRLSKRTSATTEVIYLFCKNRGEGRKKLDIRSKFNPHLPSAPVLANAQLQRYYQQKTRRKAAALPHPS